MRHEKGFTLIELLVVIGIIAILSAVLLPNLLAARKRANQAATQIFTRNTVSVVEAKRDPIVGTITALNNADCTDNTQGFPNKPAPVNTCLITAINGTNYKITVSINAGSTNYSKLEYNSENDQYSFQ